MKITIYSTATCPYCIMLKRWLDEKKVSYEDYYIDQNPIAAKNMQRLSDGRIGVPFSTIEHDNGSIDKIFGFDRQAFSAALKL